MTSNSAKLDEVSVRKMMKIRMLLITGVMAAIALTLQGTTYYVTASSGADVNSGTSSFSAKKTIQVAVKSVSRGGTIPVPDGWLSENIAN